MSAPMPVSQGRVTKKCVYCGTTADSKPFRAHLLSCAKRKGYELPSMPPTPPLYTYQRGTERNMEQEKAYRAGLNQKALYRYYKSFFEESGMRYNAMLDEAERIIEERKKQKEESK